MGHGLCLAHLVRVVININLRSMQLQRRESSAIVRPRLPSVSGGPSTSSSLRKLSRYMSRIFTSSRLLIAMRQMNVLCFVIRTRFLNAFYSKKVSPIGLLLSQPDFSLFVLLSFLSNILFPGIDVQAELRAKTGSPNLGPTHMPQNLVPPPPISRSLLNRHHSRRSNSSIAPKMEPGLGVLHPSPASRQGASSHSASPTNTNSIFTGSPAGSTSDHNQTNNRSGMPPGGMKPQQGVAMSQGLTPGGPARGMQQQMHTAAHRAHAMRVAAATAGGATPSAPFYPSSAFQSHIDQLGKQKH